MKTVEFTPTSTLRTLLAAAVRRFLPVTTILVLVSLPAIAETDRTTPHPAAPAETSQFSFMVGVWNCQTRFLQADGTTYSEGEATWTGYYILDGWAIQDDWVQQGPDGNTFHGTNIRSFNRAEGSWDNRWLPMGSLQWKYYSAERVGETMVMTGGEGKDARGEFIDRNTFSEIREDSWRWRKDRSYDGGQTWIEGLGFIEARRAAAKESSQP